MRIKDTPRPEGWQEAIKEEAAELLSFAFKAGSIPSPMPKDVEISEPIPVFLVTWSSARSGEAIGESLKDSPLTSWRCLVFAEKRPIASINFGRENGRLHVSGVRASESTHKLVFALERAESLEQSIGDSFEVCILEVPSLFFSGLWLMNESPDGDDSILPLAREGYLEPLREAAIGQVNQALREAVERQIAIRQEG